MKLLIVKDDAVEPDGMVARVTGLDQMTAEDIAAEAVSAVIGIRARDAMRRSVTVAMDAMLSALNKRTP